MRKALFGQLLESLREGGEILRGKKEASRTFAIKPAATHLDADIQINQGEQNQTSAFGRVRPRPIKK